VSAAVPVILIVVPLEGRAVARILSSTHEEELRLGLEVFDRSTIVEVAAALERLRAALAAREGSA
jgi:hypothetical protein